MEWNNNGNQLLRAPPPAPPPNFVVTNTSRPLENSFSFLYNYNYDHFHLQASSSAAAAEMKQMVGHVANGLVPVMEKNNPISSYGNNIMDKKKRLTTEQLDSLEASFQEETKLEPDRKMKLAQELGLQPRQVAVWFQNRRARWKAKQLERLYDTLKHEYDVVSNEKQKLQEEVLALRAILKEQVTKNQVLSGGYTEISGEETVESTSAAAIRCSSHKLNPAPPSAQGMNEQCQTMGDQANYVFTVDDYNPVVPPAYWGVLPSYPLN